jgi:GNAT superfamily N-acetyltransferase
LEFLQAHYKARPLILAVVMGMWISEFARMIGFEADVWAFDEFTSVLDHETAKGIGKVHYRGSNAGIVRKCFKATIHVEIAAGIVFVFPHFSLRGRNIAMPEFKGKTTSEMVKKINENISRISRVVVHPKFRSIGLGAEIVKRALPKSPTRIVETLAVMAHYNSFFESAGMIRVEIEQDNSLLGALGNLEKHTELRREMLASKSLNLKTLSRMNQKQLELTRKFVLTFCVAKKFRATGLIPKIQQSDKEALPRGLSLLRGNPLYLYWKNPNWHVQKA